MKKGDYSMHYITITLVYYHISILLIQYIIIKNIYHIHYLKKYRDKKHPTFIFLRNNFIMFNKVANEIYIWNMDHKIFIALNIFPF